jgi:chemotaxis protein MotB
MARPDIRTASGTGDDTMGVWVTSYSSTITNLMILFMVLWAYTQFLQKRLTEPAMPLPNARQQQVSREIRKELEAVGTVVVTRRKITVTLPSAVLFDPGSDVLRDEAVGALDKVATALAKSTAPIIVEGHTDDVPIRQSRWRSNYELSAARAFSVIRFLTTAKQFPPNRLAARGYGPHRPAVPNESEEQRARNRRIEIHLWTS